MSTYSDCYNLITNDIIFENTICNICNTKFSSYYYLYYNNEIIIITYCNNNHYYKNNLL